jgi:hypothetical protein
MERALALPSGRLPGADDRGDREGASRLGDRDAVVAVADRVGASDLDDGDGRQRCASVLGEPDALPPRAGRRSGTEIAIELRRSVGLQRPVDGIQRDLADAGPGRGARAAPSERQLVVDGKANALAAAAAQTIDQGRAPARSSGAPECLLGLDLIPLTHGAQGCARSARSRYGVPVTAWRDPRPARVRLSAPAPGPEPTRRARPTPGHSHRRTGSAASPLKIGGPEDRAEIKLRACARWHGCQRRRPRR